MSAASRYAGQWLPAALSRIPGLRRQFDLNRDPYIRAQVLDMEKTEAERREGRGSAMVRAEKLAVAYRPPRSISEEMDRQHFNQRWMAELRDSVFAQAANAPAGPEQQEPEHKSFQPPSQGRQSPEKEKEMPDHITVNGDSLMHLDWVRRLRVVTDRERESLSRVAPDGSADQFNTRIDDAHGRKSYARETIDQIAAQGVRFVEIDKGVLVPARNIQKVKDITERDRANFFDRNGRSLREDYKSRIETHAGMVLSTHDSVTVMNRITHPYQPKRENGPSEKAQSLEQQRDEAMAKAAPAKPRSRGRKREPEM